MRNEVMNERPCVKCGSTRTRVIGQSVSPPVFYVTCSACGHSSAVPSQRPPGASGSLAEERVDRLVRSVVADFALPVDVVSVVEAAAGWEVNLKTRTDRAVSVSLSSIETAAIRAAITRALANA